MKIETLIELLAEAQRQLYWNHMNEDLNLGVMGQYPKMTPKEWMDAVDKFFIGYNKCQKKKNSKPK